MLRVVVWYGPSPSGRDHTPKSERAAQHFWPVWPADDALVGHPDEQAVLDDPGHGLQRGPQRRRVSDAFLEAEVEDEVAVVGHVRLLLPTPDLESGTEAGEPLRADAPEE